MTFSTILSLPSRLAIVAAAYVLGVDFTAKMPGVQNCSKLALSMHLSMSECVSAKKSHTNYPQYLVFYLDSKTLVALQP